MILMILLELRYNRNPSHRKIILWDSNNPKYNKLQNKVRYLFNKKKIHNLTILNSTYAIFLISKQR